MRRDGVPKRGCSVRSAAGRIPSSTSRDRTPCAPAAADRAAALVKTAVAPTTARSATSAQPRRTRQAQRDACQRRARPTRHVCVSGTSATSRNANAAVTTRPNAPTRRADAPEIPDPRLLEIDRDLAEDVDAAHRRQRRSRSPRPAPAPRPSTSTSSADPTVPAPGQRKHRREVKRRQVGAIRPGGCAGPPGDHHEDRDRRSDGLRQRTVGDHSSLPLQPPHDRRAARPRCAAVPSSPVRPARSARDDAEHGPRHRGEVVTGDDRRERTEHQPLDERAPTRRSAPAAGQACPGRCRTVRRARTTRATRCRPREPRRSARRPPARTTAPPPRSRSRRRRRRRTRCSPVRPARASSPATPRRTTRACATRARRGSATMERTGECRHAVRTLIQRDRCTRVTRDGRVRDYSARYQGTLMTTMSSSPRTRSSAFSIAARLLCSRWWYQRRATSSGISTAICRSGCARFVSRM